MVCTFASRRRVKLIRPGKIFRRDGISPEQPAMNSLSITFCRLGALLIASLAVLEASAQDKPASPDTSVSNAGSTTGERGKKLVLKDGSFQLIREYRRNGERVRYFSAERGDWEEIPAAMVDWDATVKAEAAAAKAANSLAVTVRHQEEQQRIEAPLDIDASLPVAPGIFLPPGEGMFLVEGKSVTPLEQVDAAERTDKKQLLKQVLSPIPIVPGKKNIEIAGAKSVRRINSERPEFYLREAPPDPDRRSEVRKSSRPGETGPEIELVRLKVKGGKRLLESVRSMFGVQVGEDMATVSLQRWDVAQNVFRFTLGEPLPPGEYAFAEMLPNGVNLYVWDFGVDVRKQTAKAKD